MKNLVYILTFIVVVIGCKKESIPWNQNVEIDKTVLMDKIKGGWAGQTIGCTYGGPTEFKYKGGLIQDEVNIPWYEDYIYDTFIEDPGLYDDVYMDLTFVEVMAKEGINAPASSYAKAFANADYKLWHANQAARYNILHGIMPPQSGYWKNNPHADDIDFQIDADFIGMICPAMINKSSDFCDQIGHIMNYGDGWYGGVFISAIYTLAYISDNIPEIIEGALRVIPAESKFHHCISDVIRNWKNNSTDWKACWLQINEDYGNEVGCPEGVFNGFDIDACINASYVVMGLLYGNGDFFKTIDIATRCGQDSDCNPASAAGIWGVINGYEKIPTYWKAGLEKVSNFDFPYTKISLNRIYDINLKLIDDVVLNQNGKIEGDKYTIKLEKPITVPFEKSFEDIYPIEKRVIKKHFSDELTLQFRGTGIIVMGEIEKLNQTEDDYIADIDVFIDGEKVDQVKMPSDYIKRKLEVYHTYDLQKDNHIITLKINNPNKNYGVFSKEVVIYNDTPLELINPTDSI